MQRMGRLVGIKPEAIDEYIEIHRNVWPEVLATIRACNIRNYSIFLLDNQLFAYYEYVGQDHDADMAKMAADPKTREWWTLTEPMQVPPASRKPGEWWADMPEVFHLD
jgi:L-rhamnose mutarotase